jgi:hypothetical protein
VEQRCLKVEIRYAFNSCLCPFVAPGIGWLIRTTYHAAEFGITEAVATQMGYKRELEVAAASLRAMHQRGIASCPAATTALPGYLAVHGSQIEPELAQVLGFELTALEFNHHIAAQLEVVEQQVDKKLVAAHIQQHLPPDEGKARAQLQQEVGDVLDQDVFNFALARLFAQTQKVPIGTGLSMTRGPNRTAVWAS